MLYYVEHMPLNELWRENINILLYRVKSGTFEHQVNSDTHFANSVNPDETAPYEPSHQDSYLLLSLFNLYSNHSKIKETRSLSEFKRLSEFTRLYPDIKRCYPRRS